MKITNEQLRELYLDDLTLPDVTHGGRTKVRNIKPWADIQPYYKTEPTTLDVYGDRDIWVWSDQHFGHNNIIKYCDRPFPDATTMTRCLMGNYYNVVKPDDIVIFGGDVGFLSVNKINEIIDSLPGYKIQIVGNHDIHRDGKLYDLNFDERHLCMAVDVVEQDTEYQLLFTHYPLTNIPPGCINVHGHIHQNLLGWGNINVSVEHTNYTPRAIGSVLDQAQLNLWKMKYD